MNLHLHLGTCTCTSIFNHLLLHVKIYDNGITLTISPMHCLTWQKSLLLRFRLVAGCRMREERFRHSVNPYKGILQEHRPYRCLHQRVSQKFLTQKDLHRAAANKGYLYDWKHVFFQTLFHACKQSFKKKIKTNVFIFKHDATFVNNHAIYQTFEASGFRISCIDHICVVFFVSSFISFGIKCSIYVVFNVQCFLQYLRGPAKWMYW